MSGGKAARHAGSLVNKPNCGGTSKKAGLAPNIGWNMSSMPILTRAPQTLPLCCFVERVNQVQRTGYRATIGGV